VLVAKMDCEVRDGGSENHFTWLSLPVVRTTGVRGVCGKKWGGGWMEWLGRRGCKCSQTCVETLQIDVRFALKEGGVWRRGSLLAWAVCTGLLSVPGVGPGRREVESGCRTVVSIDTLVLNVVEPERGCGGEAARVMAGELVDVWNELWLGRWPVKYEALLQRIERVRVCIDGVLVRERGLRVELERGRREMKRLVLRSGP
jgi:hypothetical protein